MAAVSREHPDDLDAKIRAHAAINPFKLATPQHSESRYGTSAVSHRGPPSARSQENAEFRDACNEFFNMIDCLLRWVLKCSQGEPMFRPGQKCLEAVWARYPDLINNIFTESQRAQLVIASEDIVRANYYADLARYRPGVASSPYLPVKKIDFSISGAYNDTVKGMMIQLYDFEQQEQRLYQAAGLHTRFEPHPMTLFYGQCSQDGPALWALILVKWWARLNFTLNDGEGSNQPQE